MLREALAIVDAEGVAALTVRAVAARSDCSTIGVYTHFGGKDGLVEAVLLEGWEAFEAAVSAVDTVAPTSPGDGIARLVAGAHAYRDWALANRPRYLLMFSPTAPAPPPSAGSVREGARSLTAHEERVRAAVEVGDLVAADVRALADAVWAHVHGWVMLELTGLVAAPGDPRAAFDAYARALFAGLATPGRAT